MFYAHNKAYKARRFLWEHCEPKRPIPHKGKIFSSCGNQLCLNPEHLFLRPVRTLADKLAEYSRPVETGCVVWLRALDRDGYGIVHDEENKKLRAHIAAYNLNKGSIPPGIEIRHTCHVRCCVNPEHLELGTRSDNARDMTRAGRQAMGSKNASAKLSEQDVLRIRESKLASKELASIYGVSQVTINKILSRRSWKHI